jgi:ribosomal protein S16
MILKKNKIKIIKFWNKGKKNYPIYELLLSYKNHNKGFYIEKLGFFNPNFKEKLFFINTYRLAFWLNKGALINKTVKSYLIKFINNNWKKNNF